MVLVGRDIATGWLDGYPTGSKSAEEVVSCLQNFEAPTEKVRYVAGDYASENISKLANNWAAGIEPRGRDDLRPTAWQTARRERRSRGLEP